MPYLVNGESADIPEAVEANGTLFVPCADLANALGGYVDWNHSEKTAKIELGDAVGFIHNDNEIAEVNGVKYNMNAKPYIQDSTLWAPVRVFRDAFGMKLHVDGSTVKIDRF